MYAVQVEDPLLGRFNDREHIDDDESDDDEDEDEDEDEGEGPMEDGNVTLKQTLTLMSNCLHLA